MPVSDPPAGIPFVDVLRGGRIESTHAVAACACDAEGRVAFAFGDVDVPVFARSAAKPFIAAAVLRAGAAERFGFEAREIALIAASHAGEPGHVAAAASILAKIGATDGDLRCGAPPGRSPLENNCSGKHAGILALARLLDAPLEGYLEAEHPAQRAILALLERAFGEPLGPDRIAVDGCGIPTVAVSVRSGARAFARLGTQAGLDPADARALGAVRAAMAAEPWYVGGTGSYDTALTAAGGGTIVAKAGAEGIHGCALASRGLGLYLKVIDGARRAVAPASLACLDRLGVLGGAQRAGLEPHARPPVQNVAGRVVGEIRARGGNPA